MFKSLRFKSLMLLLSLLVGGVGSVWADDTYVKVTNSNQVSSGSQIIFVCEDNNQAMTSSNNYPGTNVTISNSTITLTSSSTVCVLTVGGSSGAYTFTYGTNSQLSWAKNGFSTNQTSNNKNLWTIASDGSFTCNVDNTVTDASTRKQVRHNTNNTNKFGCYTSNTGKAVCLYVKQVNSNIPSISAQNVNIAYNVTSGSIEYTLANATGNVSATVTTGDWLTLGTITSSEVPFTCSANTGSTARTATVTLSYTGATDKVVTVTQAVNPNLSNIAALTAQTAGSYSVSLTDALVTYVNGTNAYLEDASGAVMLYHCAGDLAVGDKITGTANVTYTVYNGLPEVTAFTLATGYTKTSGNTVTPTEVTIATLESNFTSYISRYVKIVGATVTSAFSNRNSTIEQSGSSIVLRDQNSTATLTTTANTTVTVTAHPSIYNSTHQIAVYEQSQIVVSKVDPTIAFNNGTVRVGQSIDLTSLFTSNSDGEVTYTITAGDSYATHNTDDSLTGVAEGTVTVKAEQAATDAFNAGEATATITVNPASVLSSIAVTTVPTKTTYNVGETFDATGMVVTATYTDNSTADVTNDVTYTPNGALTTSHTEITISYTENNVTKTTTQAITVNEVLDYATLPFVWEGGASADFLALTGVTGNGLGSDYAEGNAPYLIKLDNTGDYIQFKTNERPGTVTIGVKMIGGNTNSSIKVQESEDGETFTDVETLSISGAQNSELILTTKAEFAAASRYVRLYFSKGSNVGVGPISIAQYAEVTHNEYDLTVNNLTNVNTFIFDAADDSNMLLENEGTIQVNDGTRVLVSVDVPQGYDLQSLVIDGDDVTSQIDETGAYTFTMPTHDVTISATAVEVVETIYSLASSITSGKHYIIVNQENAKAMGSQNNNNRAAVGVVINNNNITVSSSDVAEFVIYGPDVDGLYTIYDGTGYLYAASSGSNYLRTQVTNNDNGRWTISFNEGVASIVATESSNHNVMQYNSSNTLFSCYSSASQSPVSLYEKSGEDTPTESITISALKLSTYASDNALDFSEVTGLEAYISKEEGSAVKLAQVNKVPSGTGVLLRAKDITEQTNFTVPVATGNMDNVTDNLFVRGAGSQVPTQDGSYNNYILTTKSGVIGFYQAGNKEVPTNRAYLHTTTSAARITFNFDDETTTGVSNLNVNDNLNNEVYDLQGRRVVQPAKGLYIMNGKKVFVK